jgi:hypothetical protein
VAAAMQQKSEFGTPVDQPDDFKTQASNTLQNIADLCKDFSLQVISALGNQCAGLTHAADNLLAGVMLASDKLEDSDHADTIPMDATVLVCGRCHRTGHTGAECRNPCAECGHEGVSESEHLHWQTKDGNPCPNSLHGKSLIEVSTPAGHDDTGLDRFHSDEPAIYAGTMGASFKPTDEENEYLPAQYKLHMSTLEARLVKGARVRVKRKSGIVEGTISAIGQQVRDEPRDYEIRLNDGSHIHVEHRQLSAISSDAKKRPREESKPTPEQLGNFVDQVLFPAVADQIFAHAGPVFDVRPEEWISNLDRSDRHTLAIVVARQRDAAELVRRAETRLRDFDGKGRSTRSDGKQKATHLHLNFSPRAAAPSGIVSLKRLSLLEETRPERRPQAA